MKKSRHNNRAFKSTALLLATLILLPLLLSSCASMPVIFDYMSDHDNAIILYNAGNDKLSYLNSVIVEGSMDIAAGAKNYHSDLTITMAENMTKYSNLQKVTRGQGENAEVSEYGTVFLDDKMYYRNNNSMLCESCDFNDFSRFMDVLMAPEAFRVSMCNNLTFKKDGDTGLYTMTYSEPNEENIRNICRDYSDVLGDMLDFAEITRFEGGLTADKNGILDSDYRNITFMGKKGSPYADSLIEITESSKVIAKNSENISVAIPENADKYVECENLLLLVKAESAVREITAIRSGKFTLSHTASYQTRGINNESFTLAQNVSSSYSNDEETGLPIAWWEKSSILTANSEFKTEYKYKDGILSINENGNPSTQEFDPVDLYGQVFQYFSPFMFYSDDVMGFTEKKSNSVITLSLDLDKDVLLGLLNDYLEIYTLPKTNLILSDDCEFNISYSYSGVFSGCDIYLHATTAYGASFEVTYRLDFESESTVEYGSVETEETTNASVTDKNNT